MTFTEAALEVLRSAGEPLHYKRITELAIAGNLLSHVGKTPEVTMSSRLATLVKKDRGQSPIVKVKPGVFALRESSMHSDKETSPNGSSELPSLAPKLEVELSERPLERPERTSLPGADVFPEEADDDAPILAGIDEGGLEDRGRRRRRRRRRGKGGSDGLSPEPNGERRPEVVRADAPPARQEREPARADRESGQGRDNHRRDREPNARRERDSGRRDAGRRDREPVRNDRSGREQQGRDESPQEQLDFSRPPAEGDLLGKDLADAAYHVLSRGERAATSFVRVAELLVRRGRLNGSPATLAPTVAAALRADAARAQRAQGRPRFRIVGQRVSLSEWLLPRDAVRSEENVEQAADAQRDQVRRAFVARLNDLPAAGFAELIATWLNGEGVTALRAVRRPGSSLREFHFAGTLRRGVEENRLALVVLRSGRDIERDTVVDIRGSLHHYGGATGAWLITTGRINATAREEISAEGAAPVALFGGVDLARAMEALGIGLRLHFVPLCDIDFDLLESLGDGSLVQARRDEQRPSRDRDQDQDRERDRDREQDRDQGRERGRDRERDERDRGSRPGLAAGAEASEPPPPPPVDPAELRELELLEAAEASRLVGASWDPDADESNELESEEDEDAGEAEIELRSASDDGEDDSDDEPDGAEDFPEDEVDLDPDSDDDDGDDDLTIVDEQELERRERDSVEPDEEN